MLVSSRRTLAQALVGLALLGLLATSAHAQRILYRPSPFAQPGQMPFPVNPNTYLAPNVTPQQFVYNSSAIGAALSTIPPYAMGYNPYPSPVISTGPVIGGGGYGLATVPGYSPYATAALSTSPYGGYGLSTYGGYGGYGGYGYGGYGNLYPTSSYPATLHGYADLTRATGQYWKDIQKARLDREESRRSAIDTMKKYEEYWMWYNSVRPTSLSIAREEGRLGLDSARNYASATDVWSGNALNKLLDSIVKTGHLNRGPNIALEDDTLKQINLTDGASGGNVGLLKGLRKLEDRLSWPPALQEAAFDEPRKRLEKNLIMAVSQLRGKESVSAAKLKDIQNDYNELNDKLNNSADEMSPSQYIEAKRYLRQVGQAVRALRDPKVMNYFDNTWNAKGKNVAELVDHMRKEGLRFAPATTGDEASYNALYNALRAFENGVQVAQR